MKRPAPTVDPATVAEVRVRVPIAAVIGRRVRLTRSGREWKGCCPFHGEKTPSFFVYDDHFHCFGCGLHGDVIAFTVKIERLDFRGAVERLAAETGIKVRYVVAPEAADWAQLERAGAVGARETDTSDRGAAARRIWAEAVPAAGTAAEAYLQSRGLELLEGAPIRFHAACPCGSDRLPAMIALMTDPLTCCPTGVHRTFLRPDGRGKASVVRPKRQSVGRPAQDDVGGRGRDPPRS